MRGDRDILLPQEGPRLPLLHRLRSLLGRLPRPSIRPPARPPTTQIGPEDLWAAFDYLAGEYETTGTLPEDLVDTLAARFASQTGQTRFDLQCALAEVLADRASVRFHVALRLATGVPVPQSRTALLEMLTQPDLAHWQPAPEAADGNGSSSEGLDLRPAVIAALGQLRDPSLLGLYHRLLGKLSLEPIEHRNLIAAVQWSLMNLAPGGQGEPVPAAILATRRPSSSDDPQPAEPEGESANGPSIAEAMRVVAFAQNRTNGNPSRSNGHGASAPAAGAPSANPQDPPAGPTERNELLSGF